MNKRFFKYLIILWVCFICFALCMGARQVNNLFYFDSLNKIGNFLLMLSGLSLGLMVAVFFLENKVYKGIRYFWYYWTTICRLEYQMKDANFGIQRRYYIEVPKIWLSFSNDFSSGILKIKNTLKYDRKLDDVVMSSALGKFVVERHYQTDDGNYYVYELIDGSISFKQTFNSYEEFLRYSRKIPTYKLFLDKRSVVRLQHTLAVGVTGSGKTYFLYGLILQMLNKDCAYQLYYADPKGSSLAVIGSTVASERTAVDVADIIGLLEQFVSSMRDRKNELKEMLKSKIDADYSDFGLAPHIFIFDEYASFSSVIASEEKKTRDRVKSLLYEVILQGRQLGFFLFLVMQKSDATLIDTAMRDNIPLKIVLGNSEQQTYVTAFGTGVDIPNRHYKVGEGVFTEPQLAPEPKLVQCPNYKFDILQACVQARVV